MILAPLLSRSGAAAQDTSRSEDSARIQESLANRQIADELTVSERTVHAQVRNFLRKIEFASRAQVAAWVVQRGPGAPRHS